MAYLRHATDCEPCSQLLAVNLAPDLSPATPEEEAFFQQLTVSSPAGQQRLAARMFDSAAAGARTATRNSPPRKILSWSIGTLAAAAAVIGAAVLVSPHFRQQSGDTLLAEAYDHDRLTELRIPGAAAAPLASPTRSANGNASADSTALLKAKLNAQQQFEKTPNDPKLRQTLGEIAIVEHNGETARREFEMAEALNPQLPRLKFDLGSAYFELAETNRNPLDYARAIDFFGQYLQDVHQQDPVALFDRGLCWERQSVNAEAIKDFEAALALEKDPAWRKEIQGHIDKLKAQSALDNAAPIPLTPASLLSLKSESPGDYENYLDAAGREWLPHRSDPQTQQALQQLAAMGTSHGDFWLKDLLAAPSAPDADLALSQALQASARGDVDAANAASATAIKLYQQANNQPGALRARAEHVYSLQRMGRAKDCLAEAEPLRSGKQLGQYAWMSVYLSLEVEACNRLQGEMEAALVANKAASDAGLTAQLPIIGLRTSGFLSGIQYSQGNFIDAWKSSTAGLSSSYAVRGTAMRRYQSLDYLERIAAGLNLNWTQAGLADAAADAAQKAGDLRTAAYALEADGTKQLGIGDTASAGQSFAAADTTLNRLGTGPTVNVYRADWQADRAALTAAQLGPASALAAMRAHEASFKQFDVLYSTVDFYTEYADLLRRSQHLSEAVAKAQLAVADSEKLLQTVKNASQRPAWQAQTDRAYRVLARSLADSGQPETALRAWEWYRGVSHRTGSPVQANASDASLALPPVPFSPVDSLTLVYARLEDRYVVWAISSQPGQPVVMKTLSAKPEVIESEAFAFHRLCADRNSSQQDIAVLGRALDRDLIAPLAPEVDNSRTLLIDADTPLAGIPFGAIQHQGAYLGIAHPLLILSPGWPYARVAAKRDAVEDTLPAQPHLLIVRETIPSNAALIPDEYDETSDIAARFPEARMQNAVLQRSGQSLSFSGAPALRSAVASADILHYTGHGLQDNTDAGLSAAPSVVLAHGSMLRCRLAVLAACQTFDQRESVMDDVPSFTRILLEAGATHVLATQWDVDSRMTHKLMVRLYAELADHQTFTEALRRAQQSLQSDPSAAHPYFWSAFQLVG
jgi:CHAT domain-containing protein